MTKIPQILKKTVTFPSCSAAKFIDYQIMQEAADIDLTAADEMEIWESLFQSEKKKIMSFLFHRLIIFYQQTI